MKLKKAIFLVFKRHTLRMNCISLQSAFLLWASCSLPLTKDLCIARNVKAPKGMWWCVKNRCFGAFTCGKRGCCSEWVITSGVWIPQRRNETQLFLFLREKDTLTEGQGIRSWWEWHTHPITPLSNTVLLCAVKQAYSLLDQNHSYFFQQGKWLWSPPFSWTLWSVHFVMNDMTVKGGQAGVELFIFFSMMSSVTHTEVTVFLELF